MTCIITHQTSHWGE